MNIPEDLKIFSLIYEYRWGLLIPLLVGWLFGVFYFLFHGKKIFFLWLLLFPLLIQPLNIAATYSGWHYRMALRKRFAQMDSGSGWTNPDSSRPINLNLMPPEIRAEYAKHNFHPRFRDLKAMTAGTILLIPFLYAAGGVCFWLFARIRKKAEGKTEDKFPG